MENQKNFVACNVDMKQKILRNSKIFEKKPRKLKAKSTQFLFID